MNFRDYVLETVDEIIDSDGEVKIGNLIFFRSEIVKRLDPTAYRIMVNEIIDSRIEDLQYDLDRMDPDTDADDIEILRAEMRELEGFVL